MQGAWLEGIKEGTALLICSASPDTESEGQCRPLWSDSPISAPGHPTADPQAEPAMDLPGESRSRHGI